VHEVTLTLHDVEFVRLEGDTATRSFTVGKATFEIDGP
jgi:hypothetical protein